MLNDDVSGLNGDLNSAAQCANTHWDGVPHSAKCDLAEATILGPRKCNRQWDAYEKARIRVEGGAAPWRELGLAALLAATEPISFMPLEVDDGARTPEGSLDIEFDGAHVVVRGAVDASVLSVVCEALRQR